MDKKTPQAVIIKKVKSKSLNFMPVSVVLYMYVAIHCCAIVTVTFIAIMDTH